MINPTPAPQTPYKALLFDIFGTVVDWRQSLAHELSVYFGERDINRDWEQFALDWRSLYQPAMERVRSGDRGYVILDVLHEENLRELLPKYELEHLSDDEIHHLTRAWHRLVPWVDTLPGLYRMKRKYILGTLSNGNIALMVNMARHSALPWDAILGSEPTQGYKPQPEVYLKSVEMLGLTPPECVMVAAHNNDLAAAEALGFATAFVKRANEYGPNQTTDQQADSAWTFVCDSMIELADELGV